MEDATLSLAFQVALLSAAVPLNAGILVISLRHGLIQNNLKYFIANLAILDIVVTLWLGRFLWSYATAPDNLLFLEIIYRCWLIYALLAIIMGLIPLALFTHVAAHWPQLDTRLFSERKCICYCYIVDLIPLVSYVLIAHSCYTTFLCNMNTTMYSLISVAVMILILSSWISFRTIRAKLLLVTNARKKCDKCRACRRDSNSGPRDCAAEPLPVKSQPQQSSEKSIAQSEDLLLTQDANVFAATTNNLRPNSNLRPPKYKSNSLSTSPRPLCPPRDEIERLKKAQKIALVSILQISKPVIIFLPRIINFIVNTVIVPEVSGDTDFIGKSQFLFYSNFFTNELTATIFCAQPFFDAAITLCFIRQYRKTAVLFIKRCTRTFFLQKTFIEGENFTCISKEEYC